MIDKQIYSLTERDICEHKYVKPMENHQIWFDNHIKNSAELLELIEQLLNEIINNEFGMNWRKSDSQHAGTPFRNHINTIKSNSELKRSMLSYERLNPSFNILKTTMRVK